MKYKDCFIRTNPYDKDYVVTGDGFNAYSFNSLKEAKCAINIRQRKIDTDFKFIKSEIKDLKKRIKLAQDLINKKEKWMLGK